MLYLGLVQAIEFLPGAGVEVLPDETVYFVQLACNETLRDFHVGFEYQEVQEQWILARVEHLTVGAGRVQAVLDPFVMHAIHELVGNSDLSIAGKIVQVAEKSLLSEAQPGMGDSIFPEIECKSKRSAFIVY